MSEAALSGICSEFSGKMKSLQAFVLIDKVSLGEMKCVVGYLGEDGKPEFLLHSHSLDTEEVIEDAGTSRAKIIGDLDWRTVLSGIPFAELGNQEQSQKEKDLFLDTFPEIKSFL